MSNDLKWALSSDQQIPYHDPRMIALWFKVLKWFKPDVIDYLGDTSDQACFSRWTEGTSAEFLNAIRKSGTENLIPFVVEEEQATRAFFEDTRKAYPNAEIFTALGNHDIRVFDYVDKKAADIKDQITPEALWGLDALGIGYIYYDDVPRHRFGDIFVHHGVATSQHAGESVRKDIESFGVSIIRGHSHRMGDYYKTYELRNGGQGETLRGYEIGHMCDPKSMGMKYTNVHNWQQGFAIAHIENGERPHVQVIKVTPDYVCYVDGKKFVG